MRKGLARALAADAFHQVLDNGVFRILALLALAPILFTFLVGFRADSVEILFGVKSWGYAELFRAFGMHALPSDPQGAVIGVVLELCFGFLAGDIGMLLALSATAFFVPRMLEKGTAELYFHRPVSRAWLLLSRYLAGLVFIALVASVLVSGMYVGLLLVSHHGDPGILVAALQLVYVFALIHAFSILCGVVTRSTVASILLSSFFFLFNGCIQQGWIALQESDRGPSVHLERDADRADAGPRDSAANEPAANESTEPKDEQGSASSSPVLRFMRSALDVVHLVLPKTSDATYFARALRRALQAPAFRDEDSLVTLYRLGAGLRRLDASERARLEPADGLRPALGEARFAARVAEDGAVFSLWRRAQTKSETRFGERVRVREESSTQAAQALEERLSAAGARALTRESGRFGSDAGRRDLSGSLVRWQDADGNVRRARVFKGTDSAWIYTLLLEAPGAREPQAVDALEDRLLGQLGIDLTTLEEWYPRQLGFTAPLRFNILFSVGSSLAFAAAMLALAIWRLKRIAF